MAKDIRPLSKMHPSYTAILLAFNVTKKRVVDLCNADFEEDPFDKAKNYSSWHRAMDGQEVWEGIVDKLHDLISLQTAHPRQYLPDNDPPEDDLHVWMKQIAGAAWWREVLQVSASQSAFNAWFSNRAMGKGKVVEVKAAVDEWWARVMAACARAEYASLGRDMLKCSHDGKTARGFDSYFYTKVVEEGMGVDDARELYVDMNMKAFRYQANLIDLTNPTDPLEPFSRGEGMYKQEFADEFDAMHKADYPNALPSIPIDFDAAPWFEVKQFGDRRNEECHKDLNVSLYHLWCKSKCWRTWNAKYRALEFNTEIVEVSDDGENWREPTEREKRGWDPGTFHFMQYVNEFDTTPLNSFTQDQNKLKESIRSLRRLVATRKNDRGLNLSQEQVEELQTELSRKERELDQLV